MVRRAPRDPDDEAYLTDETIDHMGRLGNHNQTFVHKIAKFLRSRGNRPASWSEIEQLALGKTDGKKATRSHFDRWSKDRSYVYRVLYQAESGKFALTRFANHMIPHD